MRSLSQSAQAEQKGKMALNYVELPRRMSSQLQAVSSAGYRPEARLWCSAPGSGIFDRCG
jgi:hypothetical protein